MSNDIEKAEEDVQVVANSSDQVQDEAIHADHLNDGLKRGLQSRHLSWIAIGGTIGTGIFLSSGESIATAGPGGALVAYVIVGLLVYGIMLSLGEQAAYMPVSGSFSTYATRFMDPAVGFSVGWNYWFQNAISIPGEMLAAGIIMQYWLASPPVWVWALVFLILTVAVNLFSVRIFGETEAAFSMIKVALVIVFIIFGIIFDAGGVKGHPAIGAVNFQNGSAFPYGFQGVFQSFALAFYSYGGVELVGLAAAESKNPAVSIPRAVKSVFYRIVLFYLLTLLVIGLVIPYDDPSLLNFNSDVSIAPFTLVFQKAGFSAAASVVNAVILTATMSACNSSMYAASRILMALAREGSAPSFLGRVTKRGVPVFAMLTTSLVGCLVFISAVVGSGQAFTWIVDLGGLSALITWMSISACVIRLRMAMKKQGISTDVLPWKAPLYPIPAIFALVIGTFVIVSEGYTAAVEQPFDPRNIVATYIGLALFIVLYVGFKVIKRSKWIKLENVDLKTGSVVRQPSIVDARSKWKDRALAYLA